MNAIVHSIIAQGRHDELIRKAALRRRFTRARRKAPRARRG